ncbi:MAG: hypothetical protein WD751_05290 [Anaerolineales bacterium]
MKSIDSANTNGAMFPAMGFWTAILLVVLNIFYLAVMAFSAAVFPPPEPLQSLIHLLVLITPPIMIILWVQLHDAAPLDRKLFSHASLAFLVIFAALVSINRFVALTVVRPSLAAGNVDGLQWFLPYGWPSAMLALEMLGWGLFFGFACLTLAPTFQGGRLERSICWTLVVTAVFNFAIIAALVVDQFGVLWWLGPVAWGAGPTVAIALMAAWFRRQM